MGGRSRERRISGMIIKKRNNSNVFICVMVFLLVLINFNFVVAHNANVDSQTFVDISIPPSWIEGFSLVVLSSEDIDSASQARDFIVSKGGAIAIYSNSHVMVGWIPYDLVDELIGQHKIRSIIYAPIILDSFEYTDENSIIQVKFFNYVASGKYTSDHFALKLKGRPLINDSLLPEEINPNDYFNNLLDKGVNLKSEFSKIEKTGVFSPGNSDSMTGKVACCVHFVESDGSIDPNNYTWTTADVSFNYYQYASGLSWWAGEANSRGITLSFALFHYPPTNADMNQGYEPILHSSSDDSLWINAIMSNLGYSSGSKFSRVNAFNTWLKSWANTNWAFSIFVAYNPPSQGAPAKFTNGYFAYAYLGGPYTQMLHKNNGWSLNNNGMILAHETGHIFWACDEYYTAGYGGCTSCNPCNSYRPITNENCEHPNCNPNAVSCIMRNNTKSLCSYTPLQVGWNLQQYSLEIQTGTGGTTNPSPGTRQYSQGSAISVRAIPNNGYAFDKWTGDASGSNNPITIVMNKDKVIKANFVKQYSLTITTTVGGTTSPSPGVHKYKEGSSVQVRAIPSTNYYFVEWTGDASGSTNPTTILMDRNKSIRAHFTQNLRKLTVSSGTGGTTNPSPGTHDYPHGSTIDVQALPNTNYRFDKWTGDASGTNNPVSVLMNEDKSIKANFIRQYKLTIQSSTGGTTDPLPGSHRYDTGETVSIRATPNSNYRFDRWTGDVNSRSNPIDVKIGRNKTIKANFIRQYVLTIQSSTGGTTDPLPGSHRYDTGETVSIRATPDQRQLYFPLNDN